MPVKAGDKVKVEYRGTLEDGSTFDESTAGEPLEVVVGQEQLISGVEKALLGMEPGQTKIVTIGPEDAYGQVEEGLSTQVKREQLPMDVELKPGMIMEIRSSDGKQSMNVTITDIKDDQVTIDANHPLAGKTLNFHLKVVEIL